jgi:hypothetical protein
MCQVEKLKFNFVGLFEVHWISKSNVFNEHYIILMYELNDFWGLRFSWFCLTPFRLSNFTNVWNPSSILIKFNNHLKLTNNVFDFCCLKLLLQSILLWSTTDCLINLFFFGFKGHWSWKYSCTWFFCICQILHFYS